MLQLIIKLNFEIGLQYTISVGRDFSIFTLQTILIELN